MLIRICTIKASPQRLVIAKFFKLVEVGKVKVKYIRNGLCLPLLTLMIIGLIAQPFAVQAKSSVDITSESAILVDADTGKIIYAKNPDVALPPASMTKMMTEYLVWEAIESGDIDWDTTTQISDYPYNLSANTNSSGIGLTQNKDYTVKSLYEAMAINSDNGTTIALAELIAGSEGEFIEMMNAKAEEMGLPDYKFVNSTGLDNELLGDDRPEGTGENETNLLSARSAALLAYHLIEDYPEALEISSIPKIEFDQQTIRNYNWMVDPDNSVYYEGIDGLKTGNTELAGYTFTGTAEVDNKRLITVIMKADSEEHRFNETADLLDYGFENLETVELFPASYQLEDELTLPVAKGKEKTVEIATSEGFTLPILDGEEEQYEIKYHIDEDKFNDQNELVAPIEKGDKVGTAELVYTGENDFGYINGDEEVTVDLVTTENVEKDNWFMIMLGEIGSFFANVFSVIVETVKGWFS